MACIARPPVFSAAFSEVLMMLILKQKTEFKRPLLDYLLSALKFMTIAIRIYFGLRPDAVLMIS